jgi:hypothetical protein
MISKHNFEARVLELAGDFAMLMRALKPVLTARRARALEYANLQKVAMDFARHDDVCRRLMTVPGVGRPDYGADLSRDDRCAAAVPTIQIGRCASRTAAACPPVCEVDRNGRVSQSGDAMARATLY